MYVSFSVYLTFFHCHLPFMELLMYDKCLDLLVTVIFQ